MDVTQGAINGVIYIFLTCVSGNHRRQRRARNSCS